MYFNPALYVLTVTVHGSLLKKSNTHSSHLSVFNLATQQLLKVATLAKTSNIKITTGKVSGGANQRDALIATNDQEFDYIDIFAHGR